MSTTSLSSSLLPSLYANTSQQTGQNANASSLSNFGSLFAQTSTPPTGQSTSPGNLLQQLANGSGTVQLNLNLKDLLSGLISIFSTITSILVAIQNFFNGPLGQSLQSLLQNLSNSGLFQQTSAASASPQSLVSNGANTLTTDVSGSNGTLPASSSGQTSLSSGIDPTTGLPLSTSSASATIPPDVQARYKQDVQDAQTLASQYPQLQTLSASTSLPPTAATSNPFLSTATDPTLTSSIPSTDPSATAFTNPIV